MSSAYDTWMQRVRDEADDVMASSEEQQALLDFLNGLTTADEAAARYTKGVAMSDDRETVYIWTLLQDVAGEFPQAHERLIELLKAISHLPPLERDGAVIKFNGLEFWKDLPDFAFMLREKTDGLETAALSRWRDTAPREFINACAFNARANHHHLFPLEQWALMLCSQAFETEYADDEGKLGLLLQAAAQYILLSGPEMYQYGTEDVYADKYAGPLLKKHREGSPILRWDFWKQRLGDLKNDTALNEDARATAEQVVEKMFEVAGNSK